jgi:hypothetical protein
LLGLSITWHASRAYDVAPDADTFVLRTTGLEGRPTITLILNLAAWIARQRTGT